LKLCLVHDRAVTGAELLRAEIETLWVSDERGRLLSTREPNGVPAPDLVLAVAADGRCLALGAEVPDAVAQELEKALGGRAASHDAAEQPSGLARCRQLLQDAVGSVELSSGPSYVVPPGTAFQSTATVTRSDSPHASMLHGRTPADANWSANGWRMLLEGALGPWAVASIEEKIVSICHCARLADKGAEAGVWTDPDFRGQGHAAAVVAAWASLLAPTGRHAFYSTSESNLSSQRVAARLKLRLIGRIWEIHRTTVQ
jgi:RimJ/RimL family protein N-acetyltransferase